MEQEEFDKRKELIELEHKYKMEEINHRFQRELELQRIKGAEIKKSIERKEAMKYMRSYPEER